MDLANIQAGDILAVRGKGFFSRTILRLTDGTVSHTGLVVSTSPCILVTEALWRVKTHPIESAINSAEHAYILHPTNLNQWQLHDIIWTATEFSADGYGVWDILMQLLDILFRTTWFTDVNPALGHHPICSAVVGDAYNAAGFTFGKKTWKSLTPADIFAFCKSRPDLYTIIEVK